jgi:glutamate carboxypeptidase
MPTAHRQRIVEHLAGQEEAMVALLRRLTLAESPSDNASSQLRVKELLIGEFEALDFAVRNIPGRKLGGSILARPLNRARKQSLQLMLGHFDTVWATGSLAQMPFEVEGNVVRGPGVFDMKGGITQILLALRTLRALHLEPRLTPVVFLNSDEEIGSHESRNHIVMIAKRVERAFVLEPSLGLEGAIKTGRKGVGRFVVHVKGRAAHAGLDPGAGASAILELSHVIQELHRLNDADRGISVNVGTVDGGIRPNVIAPESKAVVDVRVANSQDAKRVQQAIFSIEPQTPGVSLEFEGGIGRPPLEMTPANRKLWTAARDLARDLGIELTQGLAGGGSDGSTTSQYTATLDGMGPVGDGAHAPHEHLLIDETLKRTMLLTMMLLLPSKTG